MKEVILLSDDFGLFYFGVDSDNRLSGGWVSDVDISKQFNLPVWSSVLDELKSVRSSFHLLSCKVMPYSEFEKIKAASK